jgi:ribonuclease-3
VDALEAIIGAVYLDGGLEEARSLVVRFAGTQIQDIGDLNGSSGTFNDYKTALQELLQSRQMPPCRYDLVDESGPEHQKLFTIEIALANGRVVRGVGLTKRAAEQAAARQALEEIRQGDLGDA